MRRSRSSPQRLAATAAFVLSAGLAAAASELPAYPPELDPTLQPRTARAAEASGLELQVSPAGLAAKGGTLPPGATAPVALRVQNRSARELGPIMLSVRLEGVAMGNVEGWRGDGGRWIADLGRVAPGGEAERTLDVRVETAPADGALARVVAEARATDVAAGATAEFRIADCASAYRVRLGVLRGGVLETARDAADATRRADPALPRGRLFPATGARSGELRGAEQLAAALASRGGGDAQMATEWFRFLILRWTSELNAFSGQSSNPGLCAGADLLIAGQRKGLEPVIRRIETIQRAAAYALATAREAARAEPNDDLAAIVRRILAAAGAEKEPVDGTPLAVLAAARAAPRTASGDEHARALSLAETAAWLAESAARGQNLLNAIDAVFATIANAHKESCVCAF